MKKIIFKNLVFVLLIFTSLAFADVSVKRNPKDMTAIVKIEKKISYDDYEDFRNTLSTLEAEGYKLKLNSVVLDTRGGNTSGAREIGKLIRSKELNTYLAPNAQCRSACIYILGGGIIRMAYGDVWVHRTTFTDEMPIDKLPNAIKSADKETINYVESMGLSSLLSDAIVQTPNWATREIPMKEKKRWGIHGVERVSEAVWFRKTALAKGLSIDNFQDFYIDNLEKCNKKAMKFEMTVYQCIESINVKAKR